MTLCYCFSTEPPICTNGCVQIQKLKSPFPQYGNTILGRGPDFSLIYPDIKKKKKKKKKKNHKILRETLVIIIDTAFRFSLFCVLFSTGVFYYIIRFVVSAVTFLVCLINVLDLHVVSIAKLYVIKNLNLNLFQKLNSQVCLVLQMCCVVFCYLIDL